MATDAGGTPTEPRPGVTRDDPDAGSGYIYFERPLAAGHGWQTRLPYLRHVGRFWQRLTIYGLAPTSVVGALVYGFKHFPIEVSIVAACLLVFLLATVFLLYGMLCVEDDTNDKVHWITHDARDGVARVEQVAVTRDGKQIAAAIRQFYGTLADQIAEYYRARLNDPSVNCAIRLAREPHPGAELEFHTVARSRGLTDARGQKTQPIKESEGVVKFFMQRRCEGVLVITDLRVAMTQKFWKKNQNDEEYAHETPYMVICPINGFYGPDADQKEMMGLLYITAMTRRIPPACWASQRAIADLLGLLCAITFRLQENAARPPLPPAAPSSTDLSGQNFVG
jgi:hypothetical protein